MDRISVSFPPIAASAKACLLVQIK